MEGNRRGWSDAALTAVPAVVWGSTYAVTQQWLPPGRPLFAATVRALPVGLLMVLWLRCLPERDWWWRSLVLGALNIGLFYALLFFAAYRLPSGLGATLVATAPTVTMVVSRILLGKRPAPIAVTAGLVGLTGVALLVLQNGFDRPLDALGLAAALLAVLLSSIGFVLTRKWAPPVAVVTATSWQLVAGGLVLLPLGLAVEGAPPALDLPAVGALLYLGLLGSGVAYVLWFRGLAVLGPTSASIIGLLNPVVGVLLGVLLLGEHFGPVHLLATVLVLGSVVVAQEPVRVRLARLTAGPRLTGRPPRADLVRGAGHAAHDPALPSTAPAGHAVAWQPTTRPTATTPSTSSSSDSARAVSRWPAPSPSAACASSPSTATSSGASAPTGAACPRR
ncbi:EamA family transporter [Terrabacter sp. NPDC080008]|uniref:EamA family transporter n=1 Tax=Terrabacter sp. NPDC080008 TaxID=3155176 RepID=UPI00344C55F7